MALLNENDKQPLIVHITRDPRTVVTSALNFGADRGVKHVLSAIVPFWIVKPEHFDRCPPLRWNHMTPVQRIAWFWKIVNTYLNRGAEVFREDYLRIRYEELFDPRADGIRRLASRDRTARQVGNVDSEQG